MPPQIKQRNISLIGILIKLYVIINVIHDTINPAIKSVGSISNFLNFLRVIAKHEKNKAVPKAIIFPKNSPNANPSEIIKTIPAKAIIMIIIVLIERFSFKK